jgi:uncharacterized protein (DUF169 family)
MFIFSAGECQTFLGEFSTELRQSLQPKQAREPMKKEAMQALPGFLDILGLDEPPMGIYFTDERPEVGLSPKQGNLPTRAKEMENQIDWQTVFADFSCVIGHIWRARKKQIPVIFDAAHFGCPGGAFWLGFMKPQTETIIHYVSSGIPDYMEGEHYCESPDELRRIFNEIDPPQAHGKYCVVKPLPLFVGEEKPEVVAFFARPESMSGLHQLATFVTNDTEIVASPWGAACAEIITWPYKFLKEGRNKAVIGGWDATARKFFKNDELSFTVPWSMFQDMLARYESSFLTTKTWDVVRRKIERSSRVWGERKGGKGQ